MEKDTYLKILEAAVLSPTGVAAVCLDALSADKVKRQLYARRLKVREQGDTSYDGLTISISPHCDKTLYVYTKETPDEA